MKLKFKLIVLVLIAYNSFAQDRNPIVEGWYADPEAIVFNSTYWIYPTYSDIYDKQVFLDAFSSTDLVHWKNINVLLTQQLLNGLKGLCGLHQL